MPASVLRALPAVHEALQVPAVAAAIERCGREPVVAWVRGAIEALRAELDPSSNGAGDCDAPSPVELLARVTAAVEQQAAERDALRLGRVVNATGVVLHTGLGRAPLSAAARQALVECAGGCNLELDLARGERRWRGHQLVPAFQSLAGCEDALVVNNNAAATLLTLQTLCRGKEVLLSRGQLIEIGGSFRLPEIIELSGARLREVGTTNRTRLADYERAIGPDTAAILRVHPSNYRIVGFAGSPEIAELAELAHRANLLAIDDIGSGALFDTTRLGLPPEPTFPASLTAGADLVLGSGDKLLGGPQAGIILGRASLIERLRRHPLARAVRVGKLTLSALAATLDAYLHGTAERDVPTLALLAAPQAELRRRADVIAAAVRDVPHLVVGTRDDTAPVGGGSLPGADLPTVVVTVRREGWSADELSGRLRAGRPRLVPRVQSEDVLIDLRSMPPDDDERAVTALRVSCGCEAPGRRDSSE